MRHYPIDKILADPSVHTIVKEHIQAFLKKDICDAANDAELVANVMREYCDTKLARYVERHGQLP